jgi:putative oxidoreductase
LNGIFVDSIDFALLAIRSTIGFIMIAHGMNHWLGGGKIPGTSRWFAGLGLRFGKLQAWLSVAIEISAGTLLILGLFTPFACAAVVSAMAVAGLLAHSRNGFFVFKDGYEYVLALGVFSSALATLGPGTISLDRTFDIGISGWPGAAIALGGGVAAALGLLGATWRPSGDRQPSGIA